MKIIRWRWKVQIKRQRIFTKRRCLIIAAANAITIHHRRRRITITMAFPHRNPARNFNPRLHNFTQCTRITRWFHRTTHTTRRRPWLLKIFKLILPLRRQYWEISFRFSSMKGPCSSIISSCSTLRCIKCTQPFPSFFHRIPYLSRESTPWPFTYTPITRCVNLRLSKNYGSWSICIRIFPTGHGR